MKPGSACVGGAHDGGDRVADRGLRDLLDLRGDEADLAGAELGQLLDLGPEAPDAVDQMLGPRLHELDAQALFQDPVDHADEDHDAEIRVVPAVDQHRLQRRVAVALGRRDLGDDRFQRLGNADPRLGAGQHRLGRVDADDVLDLGPHAFGVGGGQVDLVDDGDDLVVVLDRLVDIGQRLRLDPLRRVDHQQRALARGEAAADLVREIDMARRVHQVELVRLAVVRDVVQPHRLRLDRDPALLLDLHVVEHLARHLALGQPAGLLDQPVGERALAMVDMRDDGKIADVAKVGHRARLAGAGSRTSA